jgi:hypothetical protein
METPKLEVEAYVIPAHKVEHHRRRRAEAEWFKNRTTGFVRCMTDVTIDDGLIARKTGRKFYELKSFGATMQWSLDKQQVLVAKEAMSHIFIEERTDARKGKTYRVEVKPRHLTVWEYDPATSMKRRID